MLKRCASALGGIAYCKKSRRIFKALIRSEKWCENHDDEDDDRISILKTSPPWHLVDLRFSFAQQAVEDKFESYEIDVEFFSQVPNSSNLYICLGGGHLGGSGFYLGIQTNIGCPENPEKRATHHE